ncbi:MAG: hypothetical protein LC803_10180 [Acidobacteria bacterium]|nr:hypothetical protein [Acidobacteriota bacterium]
MADADVDEALGQGMNTLIDTSKSTSEAFHHHRHGVDRSEGDADDVD